MKTAKLRSDEITIIKNKLFQMKCSNLDTSFEMWNLGTTNYNEFDQKETSS